jgi:hypothetical protein
MTTTTRRFPRSTVEAWPARHPYCIELVYKREPFFVVAVCCTIGVVLGTVAALLLVGI